MIVLLDNSQDLDQCRAELGVPVGQLLTPLTRYTRRCDIFAVDNGGFSSFDPASFRSLLKREEAHQQSCLFVAAPDIVGNARRTLEVFDVWKEELTGWKLALVCQDGQEHLTIPWRELDAVFIGGSTAWKCSDHAVHIIKAAKALGKWVHAGRVNDPARFEHFENLGVDSCDGNGIGRYTHMRIAVRDRHNQGDIFRAA